MRRGVDHHQTVDAFFGDLGQRVRIGLTVRNRSAAGLGRAIRASATARGQAAHRRTTESVCQNASPSPSPPIALPSSMMFEITEISGGISLLRPAVWVSTPYCFSISLAGLNSKLANWR
jgi:hypothetical protein